MSAVRGVTKSYEFNGLNYLMPPNPYFGFNFVPNFFLK